MARFQYPWDVLDRIGKSFVVDFKPGASDKEKAKIERRLRSAASDRQTKNPKVRYAVSVVTDGQGNRTGVRAKRIPVNSGPEIRIE